jgi:dihydropteroate synthase
VGLRLGRRSFGKDELVVMAIVNRTRDSFYDRGATWSDAAAMDAVDRAVAEGAAILDVGGVKAGEGATVDVTEEIRRTAPFVAAIRARYPDLVVSVDTWRHEVAEAVCAEGADLLNDTWSAFDPVLVDVAARYGVGLVCSHVGTMAPRTAPHRPSYADVVTDVVARVTTLAERAVAAGVRRDGVLVDPTHDFGKTTHHSLTLTRRVDELVRAGWPVLVALSRKDFVGETLDRRPEERLAGTLAATAWCAAAGVRVFRTHDVRPTRDVLDMVASIQGRRPPARAVRGLT